MKQERERKQLNVDY